MPEFTRTGGQARDLWLVDGSPDFAIFPGGIIALAPDPLPIWLRVGTKAFGETHICLRHGHWVRRQGMTVPELLFSKLATSGQVYCTDRDHRVKLMLRLSPQALLVMDLMTGRDQPHFSVTTLYMHTGRLDGQIIGRYPGRARTPVAEVLVAEPQGTTEAEPEVTELVRIRP